MIRLTDEQPAPQNGLIGHTRELLNIFDKQKGLPKGFPSKLDLVPNPLPQSLKRGPNHKVSDQQLLVVFFAKMQIRLRRDQTLKREVPRLKSAPRWNIPAAQRQAIQRVFIQRVLLHGGAHDQPRSRRRTAGR